MNTGSKLLVITIINVLAFDFVEARQSTFASADSELSGTRIAFDLSKIDERVTEQFKKAWEYSRCGTAYVEALVFIFKNSDGSYKARALPPNNEFAKLTFKWDPEAIAVAHTHPNSCNPRPSENDKQLADRYGVPMFTMSSDGMFMYDPTTKATTRVQNSLDWMKASNWTRRSLEGSSSNGSRR